MKKVLVAEDEQNIREFVVINLERAGYELTEAESGDQALELYGRGGDFHVVMPTARIGENWRILDIMMPGEKDGMAVCRELRSRNPSLGIILLTAKTQEMDKVSGLMMGADDYVTKPFSPSELTARVDAVYRRVALAAERYETQDQVAAGEFILNLRDRSFTKGGAPIELTQVEFQIMEYFLENPGIALARGDILRHVWGPSYVGEEKIVDVNIRRLRMKVEDEPSNPQHITTVWGLGYRWKT